VIGSAAGLAVGLWLGALAFDHRRFLDPFITALNAMPRVVLAPIFMVWFGLGIWSKVALGVTLVFFIVFFNVYQGVKEVSPVVLNNTVMLGANRSQLLRHVYLPSATSWVFSSLHTRSAWRSSAPSWANTRLGSRRRVSHPAGRGSLRHQHGLRGILVLTAFALVLDFAVGRMEKRLLVWRPTQSETEQL
jgi:NitT/TauT family transport system permease protein